MPSSALGLATMAKAGDDEPHRHHGPVRPSLIIPSDATVLMAVHVTCALVFFLFFSFFSPFFPSLHVVCVDRCPQDFEARSPDELTLHKGDQIELLERDGACWPTVDLSFFFSFFFFLFSFFFFLFSFFFFLFSFFFFLFSFSFLFFFFFVFIFSFFLFLPFFTFRLMILTGSCRGVFGWVVSGTALPPPPLPSCWLARRGDRARWN